MNKNYIYGVNFKDNGKIYNFKSAVKCPINVTVITKTEKGEQFGKVVSQIDSSTIKNVDELKEIIRISTKNDYEQYLKNLKDSEKALRDCREIVKELNLDMKIINASFTFDRKQLIFNFLADERIDFRELAKKLASIYRTRIELRQIGARDKAREIGGVGPCGQKICCANFLNHIDSVSMNMAKNQGIALNPTKINGLCGRLLCCLTYEDSEYQNCSIGLPDLGEYVETPSGKGQVVSRDILNRSYKVMIDNERIEVKLDDSK
ncbi:MAG: regulatory iron-sulfur-containing complex subunit RicT [Bacilli bacterium]|nr:regulatory iron-sulfur-containing complex subunit RicT [Bacilli bacterium]